MADWNCPALTTDAVVFDNQNRLLLIQRGKPPFEGMHAFPGGGVDIGETVEQACCRELMEEAGIAVTPDMLQLIGIYSNPQRDPRKHVVGIAYLILLDAATPIAGDDAASAKFYADWKDKPLAFDHAVILRDALVLKEKHHALNP